MEYLRLEADKSTPFVELTPNGEMIIRGRSIPEDPIAFYNPIIQMIPKCNSKTFTLEIHLDYMNTSSSKSILTLLETVKENFNSTNITIKWVYESDDDDMLEIGKDYESIIHLPIDFYELQVDED